MSEAADRLLERKERYEFHTPVFDGPLDLLLFLIQENKINIYNLDVSLITEQFLDYIEKHEAELAEIAEFYKMAADLLYIKSRMLLPVTTEMDEEYEDPRQELVDRLIEYQMYRRYTDLLINGGSADRLYISRNENFFSVPYDDADIFGDVDASDLLDAFLEMIKETGNTGKIFNVFEEVSINEEKSLIVELLQDKEVITIEEVIVHPESKMHIICSFFAILEMTKDRQILISQTVEYGTIYIQERPQDWGPDKEEIDDEEFEELIKPSKGRPTSYSILTKEAEEAILKAEQEEAEAEKEEKVEFIGEEEEIDLIDDDDDGDEEDGDKEDDDAQ